MGLRQLEQRQTMATVITLDGLKSKRRRRRRKSRSFAGVPAQCSGLAAHWRCDSKNACYAALGSGRSMYGRTLLRAECIPGGKCKAEVLAGPVMIARKRGLATMDDARMWACEHARTR